MVKLKIGVVGFQGDVSEHVRAMENALGGRGEVVPVRKAGLIPDLHGIVLPGGESTTIGHLLKSTEVGQEIRAASATGVPVMATCAGLVLISREIEGDTKVDPMGLMDVTVSRNVFGSQRVSFEADLEVKGFDRPYRAVFIRAPGVVGCGPGVEELARVEGLVAAALQGTVLGLAFHPELTEDVRFHDLFLGMVEDFSS